MDAATYREWIAQAEREPSYAARGQVERWRAELAKIEAGGNGHEPEAPEQEFTFRIDVSRRYRNKEGYNNGNLNNTFKTETCTPETFLELIHEGFPYTMVHKKHSPKFTGADKRNVKTPKHGENFVSLQVFTHDDDRKEPGVVKFWLNDPFFSRYGWAFVESTNSKTEAEKGHPTLIFDKALTDADLVNECLKAFCERYPWLDSSIDVTNTVFNGEGANVHLLGNICPVEVFEREILQPYRQEVAAREAATKAERDRLRAERECAKAEGREVSDDEKEHNLTVRINGACNYVAGLPANQGRRHGGIRWLGQFFGSLDKAQWAQPYARLWTDAEQRTIDAARDNGYLDDHAHGNDKEVLRTFDYGRGIGGVEIEEPPPPPAPPPLYPALPENIEADETMGEWEALYCDYASAVSPMTPIQFHESAGLWLVSVVIARRLVLPMYFGNVYPNLFILWLAQTTLYRKSTALDVARAIVHRSFSHLLAAQDTTPEAFLSDLAGREPSCIDKFTDLDREEWQRGRNYAAQRGWILDEMSGLLASAGRDYNAGLVEALLRFYDCDPRYTRSTRGQGRVTVRNSYLAMLGASTPAAMSLHIGADRLWSMGFWPRFAILTPDAPPEWARAVKRTEPPAIAAKLRRLDERLPQAKWPDPPQALTVKLGGGVYDEWERYNKALSFDLLVDGDLDARLYGTYGRLPVQCLKVATILAALDWPESDHAPIIEMTHLARAVTICEQWRASAHRALEMARVGEFDVLRVRVLRQLGRYMPRGATLRDLYRGLGMEPNEVEPVLNQMVELGEVAVEETKPARGASVKRFRIVEE